MRALVLPLLLACADPAGPVCDAVKPSASIAPLDGNVVDIASEAELHAGLRAGHASFRRTNAVTITIPLLLDTFPIPAFFAMSGNPGYGAHVVRGFDGPECLLRFGESRAWRVNMDGTAFEVPLAFRSAGPSVCVNQMFASTWRDVMFEYHPGRPFVVENGSAIGFWNLTLQSNGESALLTNMADLSFIGGVVEDHRYSAPNHGTGLDAFAYPGIDSPVLLLNVHQEFSRINLTGFTRARIFPGYQLLSQLNLNNVGCVT